RTRRADQRARPRRRGRRRRDAAGAARPARPRAADRHPRRRTRGCRRQPRAAAVRRPHVRAMAAASAMLALAALRAQAAPDGEPWRLAGGNRLRVVAVAGCTSQAVAVVWPHAVAQQGAAADAAATDAVARAYLVAALRTQQTAAVLTKGAMRAVEVG